MTVYFKTKKLSRSPVPGWIKRALTMAGEYFLERYIPPDILALRDPEKREDVIEVGRNILFSERPEAEVEKLIREKGKSYAILTYKGYVGDRRFKQTLNALKKADVIVDWWKTDVPNEYKIMLEQALEVGALALLARAGYKSAGTSILPGKAVLEMRKQAGFTKVCDKEGKNCVKVVLN